MSCTQAQLVLLIEYIERRLENKMKQLAIPSEKIRKTIMEIERIKQTIIDYGLEEIEKQLGV